MLALKPSFFKSSGKIVQLLLNQPIFERSPFTMTNRGLELRFPTRQIPGGDCYVLLSCCTGACRACTLGEPTALGRSQSVRPSSESIGHEWITVRLKQALDGLWRFSSHKSMKFPNGPRNEFVVGSKPLYVIQGDL